MKNLAASVATVLCTVLLSGCIAALQAVPAAATWASFKVGHMQEAKDAAKAKDSAKKESDEKAQDAAKKDSEEGSVASAQATENGGPKQ